MTPTHAISAGKALLADGWASDVRVVVTGGRFSTLPLGRRLRVLDRPTGTRRLEHVQRLRDRRVTDGVHRHPQARLGRSPGQLGEVRTGVVRATTRLRETASTLAIWSWYTDAALSENAAE